VLFLCEGEIHDFWPDAAIVKLKARSSPQRTLKIETTDTGIPLGNKEDFRSIYSITFGLAHTKSHFPVFLLPLRQYLYLPSPLSSPPSSSSRLPLHAIP
jgi:hypothetical protein